MDKCTTLGAPLFHQMTRPTWDGDGWTDLFTCFLFASGLKQLFRFGTRQFFDLVFTVPLHVQKVKSAFSNGSEIVFGLAFATKLECLLRVAEK